MEEAIGWVVLDKPHGLTSRAAVDAAAQWFPPKTALGHTGTLDPLATGVLVLAVGRATRLAEFVQEMAKVYEAEFTLGATSVTDDGEGPVTPTAGATDPGSDKVEAALSRFLGVNPQSPPAFSAVRVGGRRAYKHARAGRLVAPKAKPVRIDRIDVLHCKYPTVRVRVTCGKGTYIRSLARDLGASLGVGGYVSTLRRTAVGAFTAEDATPLGAAQADLLPLEQGVEHLRHITVDHADVTRLRLGQTIQGNVTSAEGEIVAAFDETSRLVAIARTLANGRWQPVKVLWNLTATSAGSKR